MRFIDADWLCDELGDTNMDIYTDEVKEYIDSAPTIDVIKVVRCRDCKHWKKAKDFKGKLCLMHDAVVMEDGFCNYGEEAEK